MYSGSDDKETVIDLMIQNDHINMTYNKNEKTFDIEKYISIAYEVIYLDNPYLIDKLDKNTFFIEEEIIESLLPMKIRCLI